MNGLSGRKTTIPPLPLLGLIYVGVIWGMVMRPLTVGMEAERWAFEADDSPLPDVLAQRLQGVYRVSNKRLYKPTMRKITCVLNYLRKKGGEARLGVKALAKMGFPDGRQRRHLEMLADSGVIQKIRGYSPVLAQGLRVPTDEGDDDGVLGGGRTDTFRMKCLGQGHPRDGLPDASRRIVAGDHRGGWGDQVGPQR